MQDADGGREAWRRVEGSQMEPGTDALTGECEGDWVCWCEGGLREQTQSCVAPSMIAIMQRHDVESTRRARGLLPSWSWERGTRAREALGKAARGPRKTRSLSKDQGVLGCLPEAWWKES